MERADVEKVARLARLAVGQRQRAVRTGAGLSATEWPQLGVEVTPNLK